jgi:hypothetical protein
MALICTTEPSVIIGSKLIFLDACEASLNQFSMSFHSEFKSKRLLGLTGSWRNKKSFQSDGLSLGFFVSLLFFLPFHLDVCLFNVWLDEDWLEEDSLEVFSDWSVFSSSSSS